MRNLTEITDDLSGRRSKLQALYEELRETKAALQESPEDPGLQERARRLTKGANRLAEEVENLNAEGAAAADALPPEAKEPGDGNVPVYNNTGPSSPMALAKLERLDNTVSVSAWAQARGLDDGELERGVTPDEAWGAWFRGYAEGSWSEFRSMFRNQLGTTPDADGGFLVPTVLSTRVIDVMRASMPLFAAGAVVVPMTSKTLDIARIAQDVDATNWHAEHAPIVATKPSLERVRFTAKTLPVLVKASRELAEDAPNVGQVVAQSIAGATGVELTRAALRGDGQDNSPLGISNQTGTGVTAVNGNATWTTLAHAVRDIVSVNATPNAYILHPRTRTALELQADTTNQFIPAPPSVAELDAFTTTAIPTNLGVGENETEIYLGDFQKLLIGVRTTLRIEPLRERFADNGQVAWLSWLRVDVQLEHPQAFKVLTGVEN